MTWAQDQRIAWIKERIDAGEPVTRPMLREKFFITAQTATATFHSFKARHPGIMAYDDKVKAYRRADLAEAANRPWKDRALAAEAALASRRDEIIAAFEAGALAVHEAVDEAHRPSSEPDFYEAASDYAASVLSAREATAA